MQDIEQLVYESEDIIKKVIFKLRIYRDFEEYMQVGRIAIWQAANNFDETKGDFEMFAYMTVKYAIVREMSKSNKIFQHEAIVEEDKQLFKEHQPFITPSLVWPEWFSLLNKEDQFLVRAMFQEDLSVKEIAEKYSVSYEAMKKRRQRLFTKVRQIVDREGRYLKV